MGIKKPQLLVLSGALVVIVLLVMAPRVPAEKRQEAAATMADPMRIRTAEAVALVNGEDPMRGIMALREILQDDPDNVEAHWHLGLFSIQSGQYDKALDRFKRVEELAGDRVPDVYFYLGRTYATMDSIPQAIASLRIYKTLTDDPALIEGVDRFIGELENELTTGEAHAVR
jgi:cytochrome c-type biogenesis protein CcmH/NrfG